MVRDPDGVYHYTEGFMEGGVPIHADSTYCGIDWVEKHVETGGWAIVYFLNADIYEQDICEACILDQERRLTDK